MFEEMPEDFAPASETREEQVSRLTDALMHLDFAVGIMMSMMVGAGLVALVLWILGVTPPIVLSLIRGHA